jgi:hypothetical protein
MILPLLVFSGGALLEAPLLGQVVSYWLFSQTFPPYSNILEVYSSKFQGDSTIRIGNTTL